jgi:hypothetical protein
VLLSKRDSPGVLERPKLPIPPNLLARVPKMKLVQSFLRQPGDVINSRQGGIVESPLGKCSQ